ncbi:Exonuclease SbcC [plant metagenome]|uniref:Exonuclease SbcC n=1 Tax=plant metagenome TaxID=1297885 RepID=A0A484XRZ2_9ZZZZ
MTISLLPAKLVGGGAVALAIGLGLLYMRSHYIYVGEATVQARWDQAENKRKAAQAKLQADATMRAAQLEREEREKDQLKQQEAERVAHEQAERDRAQAARDKQSAATVRGLRATIARLNAELDRMPGADQDTERGALADGTRTARELFGSCAGRYSEVASDTDRYRDQVVGLQAFVNDVCQAGGVAAPAN